MILVLPKVGWYLTSVILGLWMNVSVVQQDKDQWNVLFQNCPGNSCKTTDISINLNYSTKPPFKEGDQIYVYKGTTLECSNSKEVEEDNTVRFWITRNSYLCNFIKGEFNYYDEKGNYYTVKYSGRP